MERAPLRSVISWPFPQETVSLLPLHAATFQDSGRVYVGLSGVLVCLVLLKVYPSVLTTSGAHVLETGMQMVVSRSSSCLGG